MSALLLKREVRLLKSVKLRQYLLLCGAPISQKDAVIQLRMTGEIHRRKNFFHLNGLEASFEEFTPRRHVNGVSGDMEK